MRRVAMASVAQSSGIESKDTLMDFTFWVAREALAKAGLNRDELRVRHNRILGHLSQRTVVRQFI